VASGNGGYLREAVIDCAWATETPERSRAPRTLTLSIAPHRRKNLVPIRIEHAPNITYSHTAPTRSVIGFEAEGCRAKIFRTAARPIEEDPNVQGDHHSRHNWEMNAADQCSRSRCGSGEGSAGAA